MVQSVQPNGDLVVLYTGYGDEDTVPRERVRARDAAASGEKRKRGDDDPYAQLPIPDSLKILPSDSEAVRQRKKRRVKSIKSTNRMRRLEKEKATQASSWQKFVSKKASGKGARRSSTHAPPDVPLAALTGFKSSQRKKKKSIFASPDTITGKVGVTNRRVALFYCRVAVQCAAHHSRALAHNNSGHETTAYADVKTVRIRPAFKTTLLPPPPSSPPPADE